MLGQIRSNYVKLCMVYLHCFVIVMLFTVTSIM